MVLLITKILEKGRVNNKQLLKILKDHEARLDALEGKNITPEVIPTPAMNDEVPSVSDVEDTSDVVES